MKMQVVNHLNEDLWRAFVENHPQGNIFHTPEMFQVFSKARKHTPTLWATTTPGGEVLALLLPVEITILNGLLRSFTTRAVVYGSVLCDESPEGREALALLLRTYAQENKNRLLFTELRNPDLIKGRCGICEYRDVCGGQRGRAYGITGDYLETDPACSYIPKGA